MALAALALLAPSAMPAASADSVTLLPATLPFGRDDPTAVWDGSGNAYVFGGSASGGPTDQIVRFTPASNTVTVMQARLPRAVSGTSAVWDGAGNAYVFGGKTWVSGVYQLDVFRYTPATDTLTVMGPRFLNQFYDRAAVWDGAGNAYVFGVYHFSYQEIARYTPATNTLTYMSGRLPASMYGVSGVWDGAGNAYLFGGKSNNDSKPYDWILRYTPATDTVTTLPTRLPSARGHASAVWDGAGSAYVFGGELDPASGSTFTREIVRFRPSTGALDVMPALMPYARASMGTAWDGTTATAYLFAGHGMQDDILAYTRTPASAPQALGAATGPGVGAVTLSWQAPASQGDDPVTSYRVNRGTAGGAEVPVTGGGCANLGNVLTCTDSGLAAGQTYFYRVRAVSGATPGALSAEASAATYGTPSAPQGLAASGGVGSVALSWQAPADDGGVAVTSYQVHRGTTSGGEALVAAGGCSSLGNVLSCTDSGLADGQAYYYTVRAGNAAGPGALSTEASARTATAPAAPGGLAASGSRSNGGEVRLVWQAPSDDGGTAVTSYKVYGGSSATSLSPVTGGGCSGLGNVLTCADSGLGIGVTRYYKVAAVNTIGEGTATAAASAVTAVAPSAPRFLQATSSAGKASLLWQAPSDNGGAGVTDYVVHRGFGPGEETEYAHTGTSLSYTDAACPVGQTCYYTVSAVNAAGEGPWSNEASARGTSLPPDSDGDRIPDEVERALCLDDPAGLATLDCLLAYVGDVEVHH
jgi:hypothetical protein